MSHPSLDDRAGNWSVDPTRSTVTLRCTTMWGIATVTGTFADVTGACVVTGADVTGTVRIPVATLATGIRKRDAHLREPEFFDVQQFPEIVANVTAATPDATPDDTGRFGLTATVTVKGTTRPIQPTVAVADLAGGAVGVTTSVVLDRHDFGVDGNLLGMVGGDATVSAELVFTKDLPKSQP